MRNFRHRVDQGVGAALPLGEHELMKQFIDQIKTLKKESRQDKKRLRMEIMDFFRQMQLGGSAPAIASLFDSFDIKDYSSCNYFCSLTLYM